MLLLVISVLVLVSGGIVFAINYMNWRSISADAQETLEILSLNSGKRPQMHKDEEHDGRLSPGQPPDMENVLATLSNFYVVSLTSDDEITGWTSDRADLYSDDQVQDLAASALATGKSSGRVGSQFYRLTEQNGKKQLIVLDERLEMMNARSVLRTTALIAGTACLLLCVAAYFLIGAMVRPVQDAFDKQKQFVGDASHELKTPLAVIGANAEVLEGEIGDNEQLRYIRSEVKRTNRLVTQLLTLARMDQGRTHADLKDMDLSSALLEVVLPFESSAFEQGKQFEIDIPDGIHCTGDKAMLQQLAVILLGNAFQYADEHGRVTVSARSNGSFSEIRVSNTGPGIKPEDRERIFDRFYRVDAAHSREKEGFGLGLSIARSIVEAHKGKIRVLDGKDGETVFLVQIGR